MCKYVKNIFILLLIALSGCKKDISTLLVYPETLYYTFTNNEGQDLFRNSNLNPNEVSIDYFREGEIDDWYSGNENIKSMGVFQGETVIQIEFHGSADGAYLNFSNGDIDTIRFESTPVSENIVDDLIRNKLSTFSVYYNGKLNKTFDVSNSRTDDRETLSYHLKSPSTPLGTVEIFKIAK